MTAGAAPLHEEPPVAVCTSCGRITWEAVELGQPCNMPQPGGETCPGSMRPYGYGTSPQHEGLTSLRPGGYTQALHSNDRLVAFLYVLMRDHLPPGVVEGIVVGHCEAAADKVSQYSNDWVAAYSIELALRLAGAPRDEALAYAHARVREAQAEPAGGA
jgi:hypothetical protein